MFSKVYRKEMIKRFNLTESIINSPVHYRIPNFVFKNKNDENNQCQFHHPSNSIFKLQLQSHPELLLDKSSSLNKYTRTNYSEKKRKKIYNLMTKVQREKIDYLINKAYQKINNNIREYNKSISSPKSNKKLILKKTPLVTKEFIIDHVMSQVEKYLPNIKNRNNNSELPDNNESNNNLSKTKHIIWSHNFMEEKKNEEYQKNYRIKYIDTETNFLKKEKIIKDKTIPEVIKIHTETSFPSLKVESYRNNRYLNNIKNIYNKKDNLKKIN